MRNIFVFTCLLAVFTTHAQVARKYSNEFLNIGVDASAFGRSNAVVASTDDVNSGYWNPAGLLQLENTQLSLMHASYFANIANYDYAAFAMPIDQNSAFAVSLIRFGVDDILDTTQLIDGDGNINYNNINLFSAADYAATFSYARNLGVENLRFGANVKVIRRVIGDFADSWGFGFDLGLQYDYKKWKFGLMARDITTTYNTWNIDADGFQKIKDANWFVDPNGEQLFVNEVDGEEILTYADNTPYLDENGNTISPNQALPEDTEITLPKVQIGFARQFLLREKLNLLTELNFNVRFGETNDIISSSFASVSPALGLQLDYNNIIFVRGGVGNFQNEIQLDGAESLNAQPNIGIGFHYKGIYIDYSLTNLGQTNESLYSNIFSLKLDWSVFGKSKTFESN